MTNVRIDSGKKNYIIYILFHLWTTLFDDKNKSYFYYFLFLIHMSTPIEEKCCECNAVAIKKIRDIAKCNSTSFSPQFLFMFFNVMLFFVVVIKISFRSFKCCCYMLRERYVNLLVNYSQCNGHVCGVLKNYFYFYCLQQLVRHVPFLE